MTLLSRKRLPPWPSFTPLEPVFEAINLVGLFEWDFAADRIVPCLGMSRLFGLDRSAIEEGAPVVDFLPALHPDDRPLFAHRVGRLRGEVERLAYRVQPHGTDAKPLQEYTFYTHDVHGAPSWACGALFDRPVAVTLVGPGRSDPHAAHRAAALATELHAAVKDLGSPILQALLDVVLYETGRALAQEMRRPGGGRFN